jgi:hypothetical protein
VETSEKEWIDNRFRWLSDEFGTHRPKAALVILPTPDFFPDPCHEPDHELATDLLTVYLGLGIITANATIRESNWRGGGWAGWRVGRQGYLTQAMYGYALALYARARTEAKPEWLGHLRPDVRVPCKNAIRYLAECGDTSVTPGQSS